LLSRLAFGILGRIKDRIQDSTGTLGIQNVSLPAICAVCEKEGSEMAETIVKQSAPGRDVGQVDRIVPTARPFDQFCAEQVGDDIVLYDVERIQYHSLNAFAHSTWLLCDGQRTSQAIAAELSKGYSHVHPEAVALAIQELGESGLLEQPEDQFNARIQRRAVLKLAAAGVIGALGIPVVSSITAPNSASASTACPGCPGAAPCKNNNVACGTSCECNQGCCCRNLNSGNQDCSGPQQCDGANEQCV
jgi:hypothetical protein